MARVYIEGRNKKADSKKVTGWINKWRKRLHLTEWTILVSLNTKSNKDPDRIADITINHSYNKANIVIYPVLWEEPFKEQERAIVHELIHIPLHRMDVLAGSLIVAELHKTEIVEDSFENLTEWMAAVVWDSYEK